MGGATGPHCIDVTSAACSSLGSSLSNCQENPYKETLGKSLYNVLFRACMLLGRQMRGMSLEIQLGWHYKHRAQCNVVSLYSTVYKFKKYRQVLVVSSNLSLSPIYDTSHMTTTFSGWTGSMQKGQSLWVRNREIISTKDCRWPDGPSILFLSARGADAGDVRGARPARGTAHPARGPEEVPGEWMGNCPIRLVQSF